MKIAYISTFPPRECGIATFNSNLMNAVSANLDPSKNVQRGSVVALNDSDTLLEYKYGPEVGMIIRQDHQRDYILAANFLNTSEFELCILEHEFGIFGGESGIYILPMLHRLEKPLLTVLHTVLDEPSFIQKVIIQEIAQQSARLVVMSQRSYKALQTVYAIPIEKIKLIEHGVPDLEASIPNPIKSLSPFRDHKVILTFGLISRNKGLETVIRALPLIVARHPDIMYVVLGNTHPGVLRSRGEEYREHLKSLAAELGVSAQLCFINKFVSEEELVNYLTATDLYVTPYLNEAQSTSGTLSYAVGAGAAVISTPYWHATELLVDNRGRLFGFKDHEKLASICNQLLENPAELQEIKEAAYEYGLNLRWPKIGAGYLELARELAHNHRYKSRKVRAIVDPELIPPFSLNHIKRLTDDTGIVQHAKFGIPNLKEGYCLDDNARALIMALMAYQQNKSRDALELLPIYLSFIHYMQREDGNFRNFLGFNRSYLDELGTEDSFGRTVWALGTLVRLAPNNSYREFAQELFMRSVPHFASLRYTRGMANTIIGIANYLKVDPSNEKLFSQMLVLTEALVDSYRKHSDNAWHWFEPQMTYDNAILVLALLYSCEITGDDEVRQIALQSLEFLDKVSFRNGYLNPVGNDGWYFEGGAVAEFDQQAIETMAMILMYFQAYRITHAPHDIERMFLSYRWFLGENSLRATLYDRETQGCCDGLQETGINRNQGAESTLAYFISHITVLQALELEYQYDRTLKSNSLQPT